jgi:hypothetical protein
MPREKVVEHAGDVFMAALGFEIIRFSQARATMQTPGIPDRRYYRRAQSRQGAAGSTTDDWSKAYMLWWEAKRETGKQSEYQQEFQKLVEACGELYLVGTDEVLHDWAELEGLIQRLPNGFLRLR